MGDLVQPRPGDIVDGKYELVREIGKGGMGVVYEAMHTRLNQRVALKFLLPADLNDHEALARFEREARASAALTSPHIVRVVDVGKTAHGLPFIVMEFLEGHDLAQRLKQSGPVEPTDLVDLIIQACAAMAEAHGAGIVHRDLKPSNLFMAEQTNGRSIVKVMDFGISKITAENDELTTTQTMLGTPQYMAPEQVLSSRAIDHRADIWSLGVVLYRALTGRYPFRGDNAAQMAVAIATTQPEDIREVDPTLPRELADVVMKTLSRDPAARYQDMASLAEALAPFGTRGAQSASFRAWTARSRSGPQPRVEPPRPSAAEVVAARTISLSSAGGLPALVAAAPAETRTFRTFVAPADQGQKTARWAVGAAGAAVVGLGSAIAIVVILLSRRPSAAAAGEAPPEPVPVASTALAAPPPTAPPTPSEPSTTPAPPSATAKATPRRPGQPLATHAPVAPAAPASAKPTAKPPVKPPAGKGGDDPLHL
ncbi:MAG TPA: serine/threonine-protein kinase [Polyangiaceae bacterium]|nr:serine/threonine-protein kinase [Polyangiaceae bacterium]